MARHSKQVNIVIHIGDDPEVVGRILAVVVSCNIRILECHSFHDPSGTVVWLRTDNDIRTREGLVAAGYLAENQGWESSRLHEWPVVSTQNI